ncbi:TMEM175 family protein [Taibaiella koreensis]|uniref:TMEM175 family protein n=1 Tax=Taibaiella koreensis TaxID=1268548 RepID=UPI000E59FE76|nr:TMEM175 family protein [Taibaiella koreensis]
MKTNYNKLAGRDTARLVAISDAVFGVAMTLLVLEIKVPEVKGSEKDLALTFLALMPKFLVYFLSFLTAGIFWMGHSAQYKFIEKSDRNLNWINLLFLLFVSILPFTTAFLGDYIHYKLSIGIYWLNIFLLGLMLYVNWRYAERHNFIEAEDKVAISRAIKKRIAVAQMLYLSGTLLCLVHPYLGIAVIIGIQLNYAFAFLNNRKPVNESESVDNASLS